MSCTCDELMICLSAAESPGAEPAVGGPPPCSRMRVVVLNKVSGSGEGARLGIDELRERCGSNCVVRKGSNSSPISRREVLSTIALERQRKGAA